MDFESLVVAAATGDLADANDAQELADAVEFRMDFADDPLAMLNEYSGPLPVIATNRVEGQGGDAPATPERLEVLQSAVEHPRVEAVDIELATVADGAGRPIIEHARDHDTAVVISTHDFETTPPPAAIKKELHRAGEYGDVAKIATTATDRSDVLDLLAVTHELTMADESVATMAMGTPGRHSRVVTPLYGSCITYAPVDPARATAPGQYDLATLCQLLDDLR